LVLLKIQKYVNGEKPFAFAFSTTVEPNSAV
jgi:hypothetical protein